MKHSTPDSMKFKTLQRRLGVSRVVTAGTLELLWIATLNNAKRGDIGRFSNEEIAIECDWAGDPDELIDGLVGAGWVDESAEHRLVIHDWSEHAPRYIHAWIKSQGTTFADATPSTTVATVEATVVASTVSTTEVTVEGGTPNVTKPNVTKPKEGEAGASVPPLPFDEVLSLFDTTFGMESSWTDRRKKQLNARWRKPEWRVNWRTALERAGPSAFLRGSNDRGWVIDLEFFLRPDSVTKILEGKYDNRPSANHTTHSEARREQANADVFSRFRAAAAAQRSASDGGSAACVGTTVLDEAARDADRPPDGNVAGGAVAVSGDGSESGRAKTGAVE